MFRGYVESHAATSTGIAGLDWFSTRALATVAAITDRTLHASRVAAAGRGWTVRLLTGRDF